MLPLRLFPYGKVNNVFIIILFVVLANILIAPTVAEVSQSNAANATTPVEEDPLYLRKKKTQAKGRSATILTSSKGVNEDSTLGKKSLLGA